MGMADGSHLDLHVKILQTAKKKESVNYQGWHILSYYNPYDWEQVRTELTLPHMDAIKSNSPKS
jgi:hypothetical protein